jgi:hypothetical protein
MDWPANTSIFQAIESDFLRRTSPRLPVAASFGLRFLRIRASIRAQIYMQPLAVWVLWLSFGSFALAFGQERSSQQIGPPFGLRWAEGEKEVARMLTKSGARITAKENVQGRDAWTVEGLIQPALKRTLFYFGSEGSLVEVELQYENPDWDLVAYEEFLNSARQRLEQRYGPPTVLARDKQPQGDVMQTVVGYEWQQKSGSLRLFFFSAERDRDVYRTVSVHYCSG